MMRFEWAFTTFVYLRRGAPLSLCFVGVSITRCVE